MKFLFQIINGLHIGSIYALVALGYSMVYGIVKLINFAHGDIIMVGAYAAYVLLVLCGLPVWVAVIGSIVFCALAGVLIERIAYRRLLVKEAPRISLLITAIGVSIFLQNLFQLIFTSSGKSFPSIFNYEPIVMGERQVSIVSLITIVTTVVLMVLLQLLVKKPVWARRCAPFRKTPARPSSWASTPIPPFPGPLLSALGWLRWALCSIPPPIR